MIQILFSNQIQESSDFHHSSPTLVCSGQSNNSFFIARLCNALFMPIPFHSAHSLFPIHPCPVHLYSSLPLNIRPSLKLLLLLCSLDDHYYTKQCHLIIKKDCEPQRSPMEHTHGCKGRWKLDTWLMGSWIQQSFHSLLSSPWNRFTASASVSLF